jgi:hypothetical protein
MKENGLGRLKCRWEDNIKMDLNKIGIIYVGANRTEVSQIRAQ